MQLPQITEKRALNIRLKVLGEQHSQTADSYRSLGVTQHLLGGLCVSPSVKEARIKYQVRSPG